MEGADPHKKIMLELFLKLVAFHLWEDKLLNKKITLWTDNYAAVELIIHSTAGCLCLVCLLPELVKCQLKVNVEIKARHLSGYVNLVAEALSHFQ